MYGLYRWNELVRILKIKCHNNSNNTECASENIIEEFRVSATLRYILSDDEFFWFICKKVLIVYRVFFYVVEVYYTSNIEYYADHKTKWIMADFTHMIVQ